MANITGKYRKNVPFDDRKLKAAVILKQHPDRIPVVVECSDKLHELHPLKKNKFIVPHELTLAQFMFIIRKHMKLEPVHAIFVFINNKLHPTTSIMGELYPYNKDEDGFMYLDVFHESTFGQRMGECDSRRTAPDAAFLRFDAPPQNVNVVTNKPTNQQTKI